MNFEDLGLRAALLRAVREQGYRVPTPVQAWAIPTILLGRDVAAAAMPGSGRVGAYALPMLQRLLGVRSGRPDTLRALVLVPSPERAAHVARRLRAYGAHLPFRSVAVSSRCASRSPTAACTDDIAVATPGQALEHAAADSLDVTRIELLVLDGADAMLRTGHLHDVRHVLAMVPARRQTIFFGTAFPDEVMVLCGAYLRHPEVMEPITGAGGPVTDRATRPD